MYELFKLTPHQIPNPRIYWSEPPPPTNSVRVGVSIGFISGPGIARKKEQNSKSFNNIHRRRRRRSERCCVSMFRPDLLGRIINRLKGRIGGPRCHNNYVGSTEGFCLDRRRHQQQTALCSSRSLVQTASLVWWLGSLQQLWWEAKARAHLIIYEWLLVVWSFSNNLLLKSICMFVRFLRVFWVRKCLS